MSRRYNFLLSNALQHLAGGASTTEEIVTIKTLTLVYRNALILQYLDSLKISEEFTRPFEKLANKTIGEFGDASKELINLVKRCKHNYRAFMKALQDKPLKEREELFFTALHELTQTK